MTSNQDDTALLERAFRSRLVARRLLHFSEDVALPCGRGCYLGIWRGGIWTGWGGSSHQGCPQVPQILTIQWTNPISDHPTIQILTIQWFNPDLGSCRGGCSRQGWLCRPDWAAYHPVLWRQIRDQVSFLQLIFDHLSDDQVPPHKDGYGVSNRPTWCSYGGEHLDNLVTISLLLPQNWGLMIFDTPALLIDPSSTNDNDRQEEFILLSKINLSRFWVLNVVAHELAHQWFGNIVTLDWLVHRWSTLMMGQP